MTQLLDRVAEARKAIVAAAAPGLTLLIADVTDAVSDQTAGVVAVVAALVLTYLVPNRPLPKES